MKRNVIKVLAFILVLSMLAPMSVFAASGKVYDVYVSITDVNSETDVGKKTNTTLEESLTLVSGDARMADVLAQVVLAHYSKEDRTSDMYRFQSPEMQRQMDEGLAIIAGGGAGVNAAWAAYSEKYKDTWSCPDEGETLKTKLANYDTTVYDIGPGVHIVRHYNKWTDDAKYMVTYTVTIIISEHSYSDSVVDSTPNIKVTTTEPSGEKGGSTTVNKTNPLPGEEVRIITKPDAGNMTSKLTVTDENGNRVPVEYEGKGIYSFVMPKGSVTIEANYRLAPVEPTESGVSDWLLTDEHVPFMIGYPEGDFRAENPITRAEVAMLFYRLLRNQNIPVTVSFDDVKYEDWFSLPVEVLASLGIINGIGDGNFEPNRPITRAEFAVIASRFVKTKHTDKTFPDVSASAWYFEGVSTAAANGWVFGTDTGLFEPDRPIKRSEAAAIVNRMLFRLSDRESIDAGQNRDFTDLYDTYWGWYEIAEATYGHTHSDDEELHVYYHESWIDGTSTEYDLYKGTEGK